MVYCKAYIFVTIMDNAVPEAVQTFMGKVMSEILNPIMGLIFAAALVYFLYGLMIFIFGAGEPAKRTEGKRHMFWGLIGMVVMVSVFSILSFALNTFGVGDGDIPAPLEL
jgi:succinate dehydrogenase/fumarate reductase cytochrome b subunit